MKLLRKSASKASSGIELRRRQKFWQISRGGMARWQAQALVMLPVVALLAVAVGVGGSRHRARSEGSLFSSCQISLVAK